MQELVLILTSLYFSCFVAIAAYAKSMLYTIKTMSTLTKSSKSRKLLVEDQARTSLYLKLSILWPVVLCLMLKRKISG